MCRPKIVVLWPNFELVQERLFFSIICLRVALKRLRREWYGDNGPRNRLLYFGDVLRDFGLWSTIGVSLMCVGLTGLSHIMWGNELLCGGLRALSVLFKLFIFTADILSDSHNPVSTSSLFASLPLCVWPNTFEALCGLQMSVYRFFIRRKVEFFPLPRRLCDSQRKFHWIFELFRAHTCASEDLQRVKADVSLHLSGVSDLYSWIGKWEND